MALVSKFEIFEQTKVDFPIVFTTAFDEYALTAFKVNSIDYLMKPIKKHALQKALEKYNLIYQRKESINNKKLLDMIQELKAERLKKYKKSFLVYIKDKILPIATADIAYFCLVNETIYCFTHKNQKFYIDQGLDKIQNHLNPDDFYRANRQFIVARKSIKSATVHFHRKLKLEVAPYCDIEIIVSKPKSAEFKKWLAG